MLHDINGYALRFLSCSNVTQSFPKEEKKKKQQNCRHTEIFSFGLFQFSSVVEFKKMSWFFEMIQSEIKRS